MAGIFSQQRTLKWLLRGHMISNNETVSRQNLWAGNIAKSMTSEGKSALLPARVDRSHTEKVFFVGYISNHLKTGHEVNSSFCFPSGTVIKCWQERPIRC